MINPSKRKTAIMYLEFSEALLFAAFVSLLIETTTRLDLLIEVVEELGRATHYEDFHEDTDIKIVITSEKADSENNQVTISECAHTAKQQDFTGCCLMKHLLM
ncbi:hypothetical protein AQUCO_05200013v1 [Aquilegia coerulea]|uniref:Uncharacterized protein n=1 Tax=Aquilegia coerulea TaxID=218851 RepID=A0A2G5CIL8_AQUCA|nr:hypothetical protein AQUCO_05200013v1 [Aquilegia coerulea]